jgi:hypothetical protein
VRRQGEPIFNDAGNRPNRFTAVARHGGDAEWPLTMKSLPVWLAFAGYDQIRFNHVATEFSVLR